MANSFFIFSNFFEFLKESYKNFFYLEKNIAISSLEWYTIQNWICDFSNVGSLVRKFNIKKFYKINAVI